MARYLYTLMMLFSDQGYVKWTSELNLNAQQQQELTSRRVAQWAINAVCFRDPGSAMTPFEYQADIFTAGYSGWQVDGDPNTDESQTGSVTGRRIVWGCKPPDVVLTETFACHDKRTGDTATDDSSDMHKKTDDPDPKKQDPDFDQIRIPQGSLFIELYCCRNPNNPVAPGDLYTYDSTNKQWLLDLGKMAPDGSPVWRMAITENARANTVANAAQQVSAHPDTVAFQSGPDDKVTNPFTMIMNSVDPTQVAKIERIVWLGSDHSKVPANSNVFYNRNQNPTYLLPGGYAVVGPRAKTAIGSNAPTPYGQPAAQTISLTPNVLTAGTASDAKPADIKQPLAILVGADAPTAGMTPWTDPSHTNKNFYIGLNVSEPLPQDPLYYPEPTVANAANGGLVEAYGDLAGTDTTKPFKDHPMDYGTGDPQAANRPLMKDSVQNTGTYPFYKTVFLQRLADPSAPWDAKRNPYITVDWMPIDLTTFNGEEAPTAGKPGVGDPNDNPGFKKPQVQFVTRQRGNPQIKNPIPSGPNLWAQVPAGEPLPNNGAGAPVPSANFGIPLTHSIGYLNQGYGPAFTGPGGAMPAPTLPQQYVGDPQKPFPWLTWNARPYASVMELLMVPSSSPDRLLVEFNTPGTTTPATHGESVRPGDAAGSVQPSAELLQYHRQHLRGGAGVELLSALEYMTVPSRFIGTETYLNPNFFGVDTSGKPMSTAQTWFLPPYNTVSQYRDPGKINLNTITSKDVFAALINAPQGATIDALYADFCDSRRGDGAKTGA